MGRPENINNFGCVPQPKEIAVFSQRSQDSRKIVVGRKQNNGDGSKGEVEKER